MHHIGGVSEGGKSFVSSIAQRRLQRRPMGLQLDTTNANGGGGRGLIPAALTLGTGSSDNGGGISDMFGVSNNAAAAAAAAEEEPPLTARGTWNTSMTHAPMSLTLPPQTPSTPAAFPALSRRPMRPAHQANPFAALVPSSSSGAVDRSGNTATAGNAAFTASGASTPSDISELSLMSFQKGMGGGIALAPSSSAHLSATAAGAASPRRIDMLPVGAAAGIGGASRGQLARCPQAAKNARVQPLQDVPGLHYISCQGLAARIRSRNNNNNNDNSTDGSSGDGKDGDGNGGSETLGLIVDMRKSADYMAAHIAGAVSMTAPTTLVKRRTFTVERLLSMLRVAESQKKCVSNWKAASWVVLYGDGVPEETATEDSSLVMLARKFMAEAPDTCMIFVMQGGFRDFSAQYRDICEHGCEMTVDPLSLSIANVSATGGSQAPPTASPLLSVGNRSVGTGPLAPLSLLASSAISPALLTNGAPLTADTGPSGRLALGSVLNRPSIAKPKPTVDVNHPMLRTMRQTPGGGFDPTEVVALRLPSGCREFSPENTSMGEKDGSAAKQIAELPPYLRRTADPDTGPRLLNQLFKCIDASESRRMSSMIGSNGMVTKYNQYTIAAGLELGSKNRYTNIFPFDNNRVRLRSMRRRRQSTGSTSCCEDGRITRAGVLHGKDTGVVGSALSKATHENRPMSFGNDRNRSASNCGGSAQPVVDMVSPVDCGTAEPMLLSSCVGNVGDGGGDVAAAAAAADSSASAGNDYVNASYVSYFDGPLYIATQGPLPETVYDFWKMVWEHRTRVVVMLTREFENGRSKCHRYWPKSIGDTTTYGDLCVQWQAEAVHPSDSSIVVRRICVSRPSVTDSVLHVTHLQYLDWADHSVPETPLGVLRLRQLARAAQEEKPQECNGIAENYCDDAGLEPRIPMVVHCSAGCGRTGAFCAIDTILSMNENGERSKTEDSFAAAEASVDCDGDISMRENEGGVDVAREEMQMLPVGGAYDRHGEYTGLVPQALRSRSSNAALLPADHPDRNPNDITAEPASAAQENEGEGEGESELARHRRSLTRWNEMPPPEFHGELVFMVVSRFRELRVTMVQTIKQFVFCHEALAWDALGMGPRPLDQIIDRRLVAEWNRANYPGLSESDCSDITYLMRGRKEMVQAMSNGGGNGGGHGAGKMAMSATNDGGVSEPMTSSRASIDVGSTGSLLMTGSLGRGGPIAAPPGVKRSNTVGPARRGFFTSIFNRNSGSAESSSAEASSIGSAAASQHTPPQSEYHPHSQQQQSRQYGGPGESLTGSQFSFFPANSSPLTSDPRLAGGGGGSAGGYQTGRMPPVSSSHAPITEESPSAVAEEEEAMDYHQHQYQHQSQQQQRIPVRRDSTTLPLSPQTYGSGAYGRAVATPAVVPTAPTNDYFGIICTDSLSSGSNYTSSEISSGDRVSLSSASAADWRRSVMGHLDAARDGGNNGHNEPTRQGSNSGRRPADDNVPTASSPSAYVNSSPALASPRVK
ncbi:hypothetical protein GGH99_000036 [Coemansia sp. RSA 1285]|nr:hypothetical protein GGH99_000036 [Coemansia sp. RSA 1285]